MKTENLVTNDTATVEFKFGVATVLFALFAVTTALGIMGVFPSLDKQFWDGVEFTPRSDDELNRLVPSAFLCAWLGVLYHRLIVRFWAKKDVNKATVMDAYVVYYCAAAPWICLWGGAMIMAYEAITMLYEIVF